MRGMRIIGGLEAAKGQFPYQASMLAPISPTNSRVCGGSIISKTFVLTAAHCTSGLNEFRMGFGSNDFNSPQVTINSIGKIEHPNFNPNNFNNDISLILLSQSLTFSDTIGVVSLPSRSQAGQTFENERVINSGYGATADGGAISPILNYVYLRVIGNAECRSVYIPGLVEDVTLCTRGGDNSRQSPCSGDSGGPLTLADKTLVGVTSFVSTRGCASGDPAGFVRVSLYLDWISQNTGIQIRP